MNKAQRVPDYLGHILEAIERVRSYTADIDESAFLSNQLIQDAVIRNIGVIGEAANNIQRGDPSFAEQTVQEDLPILYRLVKAAQS